jgi:hypothetical protein
MTNAVRFSIVLIAAVIGGCRNEKPKDPPVVTPPADAAPVGVGTGPFIDYSIGSLTQIQSLYPYQGAPWLPAKYGQYYSSNVTDTVALFTNQSLNRDVGPGYTATAAVRGTDVYVHIGPTGTSSASDVGLPQWMATFASIHKKLVDTAHAGQALVGIGVCQQTTLPNPTTTHCADAGAYCWKSQCENWSSYDKKYEPTDPWALFLPFVLPMINQKTVLFLDYPPDTSFGPNPDYLNNFTMCRYNRVLSAVTGIANPSPYDTIVDSRPIGAPGSGMSNYLPNGSTYFDNTNPAQGGNYLRPMLQLLTNPAGGTPTQTLPVVAMGSPAQAAWAKIVGKPYVNTLDVGQTQIVANNPQTSWMGANHPDQTTYGCCPNDPSSSCANTAQYDNQNVCFSEHQDFISDCWEQLMSNGSGMTYDQAKAACITRWKLPPAPTYSGGQWSPDVGCQPQWLPPSTNDALTFCIQVKLDNNNKAARCNNAANAQAYCQAHGNNPCATFDCAPYTGPTDPATCNQYREKATPPPGDAGAK